MEYSEKNENLPKSKIQQTDGSIFDSATLLKSYPKEVVDGALSAIDITTKFINQSPILNDKIIGNICSNLLVYQDREEYFDAGKRFDSDPANSTYAHVVKRIHLHDPMLPPDIQQLTNYIKPGGLSADLFCGSSTMNGRHSSLHGTVLLHNMLGVEKILAVDLFNQRNLVLKNDASSEYNKELKSWNYHYHIPREVHKQFQGKYIEISIGSSDDNILVVPDIELYRV